MILYSDKDDHYSHRVRIVLAEKDIACEIRETNNDDAPEEVLSINPYHELPILVDRDLGLYNTTVMMEYLDERFPHPPLLPVYPVTRANSRTLMLRIDKEICPLVDKLSAKDGTDKELLVAKEELPNGGWIHKESLKVAVLTRCVEEVLICVRLSKAFNRELVLDRQLLQQAPLLRALVVLRKYDDLLSDPGQHGQLPLADLYRELYGGDAC